MLAPRSARFIAAEHPALHPGRCARIELDGVHSGFVGELHPQWRQSYELPTAPIVFELDISELTARDVPAFTPVPRQQSVWRDISVMAADAVTHDTLMATIREAGGELLRSVRLFDLYRPAATSGESKTGERSLSVRLELLDPDAAASFTDDRIDAVVADVLAALNARLGVRLRA